MILSQTILAVYLRNFQEQRAMREDYLTGDAEGFSPAEKEIEKALIIMLDEHPTNRMAFEYLMSYYLLNKDLNSFMNSISLIKHFTLIRFPEYIT